MNLQEKWKADQQSQGVEKGSTVEVQKEVSGGQAVLPPD